MKKIVAIFLLSFGLMACGGVKVTPKDKKIDLIKKSLAGDAEAGIKIGDILIELQKEYKIGKKGATEEIKDWEKTIQEERNKLSIK